VDSWWAASYVILWLLVIVLCFVVVALARQVGTLHLRLGPRGALEMDDEGPPIGEAPVAAELTGIDDRTVDVGGPGAAQVLLFVSPGCHLCEEVLPSIGVAARTKDMVPVVLVDADPLETKHLFENRKLGAAVASGSQLAASYGVPGAPYVVVLDALGVVRAKGTVNNLEQLEGLIDTAVQRERAHQKAAS
jgi:methylamine dehydrogenase accessory protein MauD